MVQSEIQKNSGCSCSSGCCSPQVIKATPAATVLSTKDILGAWKVRWGIGRMNYKVAPGLYSVGKPDENSPVLVTANYKLTFDNLRKELTNLNLWILVLDTKGVNVWCAAGKGSFGTDELVRQVKEVQLSLTVKHKTLILPQLGATGIAAHQVAKRCGFRVVYGPIQARDIRDFLNAGMKATKEMRQIPFTFADRVILTPVEFIQWSKPLLIFFGALFILNALGLGQFGQTELWAFLGSVVAGCVLTPALLPWIPGRAFAFKGAFIGLIWTVAAISHAGGPSQLGIPSTISYLLLLPSISAYTAMNFTGSSTYTSPSGVNKEMRIAIPIMLIASVGGVLLLIISNLINSVL